MFSVNRTFSTHNQKTGTIDWYFQAREGNCGPFPSQESAELRLNEFKIRCAKNKDDGGRNSRDVIPNRNAGNLFEIKDHVMWV